MQNLAISIICYSDILNVLMINIIYMCFVYINMCTLNAFVHACNDTIWYILVLIHHAHINTRIIVTSIFTHMYQLKLIIVDQATNISGSYKYISITTHFCQCVCVGNRDVLVQQVLVQQVLVQQAYSVTLFLSPIIIA